MSKQEIEELLDEIEEAEVTPLPSVPAFAQRALGWIPAGRHILACQRLDEIEEAWE